MTKRCSSYYTATLTQETDYPSLEGHHRVDVVIIGGGFTGVATAVELAEKGLSVAIVESHKIGWGATGRNGGQVTGSLSGDKAMRKQMRRTIGDDVDQFIWDLRWRGHHIIKQRVERYGISCDLKHGHLHAAYKPSHMDGLREDYEEAVRRGMGEEVALLDRNQVVNLLDSDLYHGAVKNMRNMHLHPLNLCIGEARAAESLGALIFENSEVLEIILLPALELLVVGSMPAKCCLLATSTTDSNRASSVGRFFQLWAGSLLPRRWEIWHGKSTVKTWLFMIVDSYSTTTA